MNHAEVIVGVKKWGNLGVCLPSNVEQAAHLQAEQMVRVTVCDDGITITSLPDAAPTLAQRLARFDPARHGGKAMVADAGGAEKW